MARHGSDLTSSQRDSNSMQIDEKPSPAVSETNNSYHSPPIPRPSSAVPIRPFAQPPLETSIGIASTVPYVPASSQTAKKEFGYVQKRLRKTSMDVAAMVIVISKAALIIRDENGQQSSPPEYLQSRVLSFPMTRSPKHIHWNPLAAAACHLD